MTPALRWAAMRAILMFLLIVRDKVTKQCPQTTASEEKGEPKRYRTEVLLAYRLTARPNRLSRVVNDDDDELMLNVLRCQLTY